MPEPTSTSGLSLAAVSVALLGPMAGPILGRPLSWFGVLLALAIVLVQLVTSHYWAHGAPWQFDYKKDRRA